ncbi:protein MULTIPOLAR SPINDLE 1 [Diospyros lotus]|uniref:protein MULTIPOLAR SPINDLE 1 n=1 Tax=Diospyros lotus TaxID=55363 RepID=UPI00224DA6D7|nr:protein MULTIPOLAR SPINDLE 1 [Diospyros lotus]
MSSEEQRAKTDPNTSMKLAIAMALLRSKLIREQPAPAPAPPPDHPPPSSSTSESDALKWRRKAKERKQELLRLKEDLRQAEEGSLCDLFPQNASCKCHFFDHLGKLTFNRAGNSYDQRFNDVLRRRFLRQVRLNERRRGRKDSLKQRNHFSEASSEDETEELRASVDFLVELCETLSPVKIEKTNFVNWLHQAVDFILAALKNILSKRKDIEFLEGIVSRLIVRLVRRMCTASQGDELHHFDPDAQLYIQHLLRKLGSEPYVGQRVILSVSQRIIVLAESLLFMDLFDDAFPSVHDSIYILIQLIEFLVSDHLLTWSSSQDFDMRLFEDWVASILHARKALELLENRNGLYVLYMDRMMGGVAKQVGQVSSLQNHLNPDILANLLH